MKRLIVLAALQALPGCQRHKPLPLPNVATQEPPAAAAPIGIPACDEYLRRVAACRPLPQAARDELTRGAGVWKAAGAAAASSCEGVAKTAAAQLAELGC